MFDRIIAAVKVMWAEKRQAIVIAVGYVVFMLLFYVIGSPAYRITDLLAVVVLTGFYAGLVWFIKKYLLY